VAWENGRKVRGKLREYLFQVFAPFADFDEGVQKTFNENDHRKQTQPGALSSRPTIRVDRFGRILRFQGLRFVFEMLIGFGQALRICAERNRHTLNAIISDGGGHDHFFTVQPSDFFVSQ